MRIRSLTKKEQCRSYIKGERIQMQEGKKYLPNPKCNKGRAHQNELGGGEIAQIRLGTN